MDLPTYTNIWRIEKRLYKLYDFRLPAPLPITWIGVFVGITVPYVLFLIAIGLPFNHNLVWLYVLPPGVLTWLTTRPVIESKRLPELVSSQLRYVAEPRTWCRMAPFAEKDDILVTARVWHRHPPKARPKRAKKALVAAKASAAAPEQAESAPQAAAAPEAAAPVIVARSVKAPRAAAPPLESPQPLVSPPAAAQPSASRLAVSQPPVSPVTQPPAAEPAAAAPAGARSVQAVTSPSPQASPRPVPQRVTARAESGVTKGNGTWPRSPWARESKPEVRPSVTGGDERSEPAQRPPWLSPRPASQDARALEVSHDAEPGPRDLGEPGVKQPFTSTSWPSLGPGSFPRPAAFPEVGPFPEAGAFPEVGPFPEAGPFPEPGPVPESEAAATEPAGPAEPSPGIAQRPPSPSRSSKARTRWFLRAQPRLPAAPTQASAVSTAPVGPASAGPAPSAAPAEPVAAPGEAMPQVPASPAQDAARHRPCFRASCTGARRASAARARGTCTGCGRFTRGTRSVRARRDACGASVGARGASAS